ncbi:hypothetical protein E2562_032203 [Oryza meyeriana var. granulata]|uniref:DUF834 domain-containing protein n=1 Tax=Oryza meyeriana var. granulata TaxID=110450 RepID=A0A6G1F0K6_9ORYZ|nr:hypothetical protein E2562_032203 [Oryza meyeriana var. granulata]
MEKPSGEVGTKMEEAVGSGSRVEASPCRIEGGRGCRRLDLELLHQPVARRRPTVAEHVQPLPSSSAGQQLGCRAMASFSMDSDRGDEGATSVAAEAQIQQ